MLDGVAGDIQRAPGSNGRRIRYTSTNERGEKVPVTGAFYKKRFAKGVIALAPGTRGLGDQCAPSAGASMLLRIEDATINVNSVVVTDYIGLGTGARAYRRRPRRSKTRRENRLLGLLPRRRGCSCRS